MVCKHCNKDYPETEFETAGTINGKRYQRKKCRSCRRIDKAKLRERNRRFIESIKKDLLCSVCGNSDFRTIDFHHNNDDKEYNIADLTGVVSLKKVEKEIKKCIPICSNCHRILHYEEKQSVA